MISLNILSPSQKKNLAHIEIYYIVKNSIYIIISLCLIFSVALFFTKLVLDNYNKTLQEQIASEASLSEGELVQSTNEAIIQLNRQLTVVNNIQSSYIQWTDRLSDFVALVPDSVTLKSVNMNTETKSLNIEGVAASRDDLLIFRDALNNSDLFENITTPLSNLTQKENINFTISGTLSNKFYGQSTS